MLTGDYGMHARDAGQPGAVGNARRRTSVSPLVLLAREPCQRTAHLQCTYPSSLTHSPVGMEHQLEH